MPSQTHPDYDYPYECAAAISNLVNGRHPRALREEIIRSAFGAEQAVDACLGPVIDLYDALHGALDLTDERVPFLFASLPQIDGFLWDSFIVPPSGLRDPVDPLRGIFSLLNQVDAPAVCSAEAFTAYLVRLPLPLESRSRLLLASWQFEALDNFLRPFLADAEALLRERLPGLHAAYDATREALAASPPTTLAARLGFTLPPLADTTCPLALSFAASESVLYRNGRIRWGVNALALSTLKRREVLFAPDRLREVRKALADGTKHDILRMLRAQTLFGGQLAERTGLSSATISHHIAHLMSLHLIKAERDGTRVYYAPERDLLDAYLREIRAELLDA